MFKVHQDADDATVLLFEESKLDELADALKLRRKRRVSEAELRRLAKMSAEHSPFRSKSINESKHTA